MADWAMKVPTEPRNQGCVYAHIGYIFMETM
jgi:hypothetical protein